MFKTSPALPIFNLLIAMSSIQLGAALAKHLFPLVGAVGATGLRLSLAAFILSLIWRPWIGKLSVKQASVIAVYGASLGVMNLLFYLAIERIPLGIAVALEFTGPLMVSLASSRRALDLLWALLAALGIVMVLPATTHTDTLDMLGVVLALGAGFCWALYIIFGQRAGATIPAGRATSLGMLIAALVVFPIAMIMEPSKFVMVSVWPQALLMALLSSAIPYSLEMTALKKLPAKTFGILMSLEPALAALSGLIFLGEHLSATQWLAIACVISAAAGSSLSIQKPHKVNGDL